MSKLHLHWSALLAFSLSAGLTALLFVSALDAERANTRLEFSQTAAIRIHALRTEVQETVELLQQTTHHLELNHGGNLPGFAHYTQPALEQHPYLQALGYNPKVLQSERAYFEKKAATEQAGFHITESLTPGRFTPSTQRAQYYPFLYVAPLDFNSAAIGFDVATETSPDPKEPRHKAMNLAFASDAIAVSAPVTLVLKKSSGNTGVIAFSPLYREGSKNKANFFGFVTLVLRVGDMLQWSQRLAMDRNWKNIDLFLQDVTEPVPVAMYGQLPQTQPALHYDEIIAMPGNRQWRVTALPTGEAFSLAPGTGALTLLLAGSALSLLLGAMAQVLAGKAGEIRRQVQTRTVALATANQQLRTLSVLQKSVLTHAGYAIIATDNDGLIQVFNPAAERILGYAASEVVNRLRPSIFHSPGQLQDSDGSLFGALVAPLARLSPGTPYEQEVTYWDKAGRTVPIMLSLSMMLDDEGHHVGYMGIAHDITAQKAAQARISRLAHYDTLTDLPNRLQLRKELRRSIASAKRYGHQLGVMFVDLDRFKNINDSLGHGVGDRVLQATATRLQSCLREGDLVARMGGDEFIVLLHSVTSPKDAAEVADRIQVQVSAPVLVDSHVLTITPSIGIAIYPEDGTDSDALIQNADTAMYSAKEQGRDNYRFFTRSMNERVSARLAMESCIRRALKEELFLLHYQPQFDVATGQLVGAEALVRMRADTGLVPPCEFIPVAEDCGLILPLGDWVLAEAARCNRVWLDAGLSVVPIAVNVSARQFEQPEFCEHVQATLQRIGLEPRWLEIELTESTIMQSADKTLDVLLALKAQVLNISIDDFGTGFSSLAYLRRFPIDSLKIDRSFVEDLKPGTDGNFIVKAIISLAHQLNLTVIAEGVETPEQADLLRELGCNTFQGYLTGRPMDAASFEVLLRDRTPAV